MSKIEKTKQVFPALYSQPVIERLDLPSRAEMLPRIESGEIDHLDFRARVFGTGRIRNPYQFRQEDMPAFAASFEGQPYLRNHDSRDIDARDGTIVASVLENGAFVQDIRLTTRRGMVDYLEGKMDRFSIGWDYEDAFCTICNTSWFSTTCPHWPGQTYQTPTGNMKCELLFISPTGNETSAVNVPAVENTGIVSALEYKQEVIGEAEILAADEPMSEPAGQVPGEDITLMTAQARRARQIKLAECTLTNSGEKIMNFRELLSARTENIKTARALASQADEENRDFSEDERAEFDRLMTEVEAQAVQINKITEERARLQEAEAAVLEVIPQAEKPEGKSSKLLSRAEFEQLPQADRAAFTRGGGKVQ